MSPWQWQVYYKWNIVSICHGFWRPSSVVYSRIQTYMMPTTLFLRLNRFYYPALFCPCAAWEQMCNWRALPRDKLRMQDSAYDVLTDQKLKCDFYYNKPPNYQSSCGKLQYDENQVLKSQPRDFNFRERKPMHAAWSIRTMDSGSY